MPLLQRPATEREKKAEEIARRLDRPVTLLGIAALALWLAEPATDTLGIGWAFEVLWALIWVAFAVEFVARTIVAPDTLEFLRRRWWELIFLGVPMARFLRVGRAARGLGGAVQSSRTAGHRLRDRLVWLAVITAIIIFAAARLLWEYGGYRSHYLNGLHDAALAAINGQELTSRGEVAQTLEVVLALFAVVLFASTASSLAAFFMGHVGPHPQGDEAATEGLAGGATNDKR